MSDPTRALAGLARREADAHAPPASEQAAARARLLLSADLTQSPSRRWMWAMPVLAAAAALVVWWRLPAQLSYQVSGAQNDSGYVSARGAAPASVRFSDETEVTVEPGSRVLVEETTRRGARVLLERGTANVHVVHRSKSTSWTFAAGPFEVLVTGTRFGLHWDPAAEVLDVQLREGSVEIRTPFNASPIALRAGQDFHGDLPRRSMTTRSLPPTPFPPSPVSPAPAPAPADSALPEVVGSGAPPPVHAVPPLTKTWSKLVAAGQFADVLAQANERGTGQCLRACNAGDLSALADAARYSGKTELASESLNALRTRFAGSSGARNAAFFLGRLSERQGATARARSWYQRYLTEAPSGPYADEAFAGQVRTTQSLDGKANAVPLARQYLQRFPNGAFAKSARGLVGTD